MLTRTDLRGYDGDLSAVLPRPSDADPEVVAAVARDHRRGAGAGRRGAAGAHEAVRRLRPRRAAGTRAEIDAALERLDPDLRAALEFAADQIVAYHEAQREARGAARTPRRRT